jgi:hypothetical protein
MAEPEPQIAPADPQRASVGRLVSALYLSGAITVVIGIVLGFVISPILFAVVAFGIIDGVIAGLFSSGRIGPLATRRRDAAAGDASAIAESDPSFNPYARED